MKIKPAKKRGEVVMKVTRKDEAMLSKSDAAAAPTPFALKKILVPIDFSECSKKALRYAVPLAQQFNASVVLLYVIPANYPVGEFGMIDFAYFEKEMRTSGERQLTELAKSEVGTKAAAQTLVRVGRPVAQVLAVAKDEGADLIVVSTHGHTGLKHVLLGSVAENIVRYSPCPVLVVREHEHEFLRELTE